MSWTVLAMGQVMTVYRTGPFSSTALLEGAFSPPHIPYRNSGQFCRLRTQAARTQRDQGPPLFSLPWAETLTKDILFRRVKVGVFGQMSAVL